MTTNIAGSVNSAIFPARRMPITAAHEFLKSMTQRWFLARHEVGQKLQSSITSTTVDKKDDGRRRVIQCLSITEATKYQVRNAERRDEIVNIEERTCFCSLWQLDQFPCFHAIAHVMSTCQNPSVSFTRSTSGKRKRIMHCTHCKGARHTVRNCRESTIDMNGVGDRSSQILFDGHASREKRKVGY